MDLTEDKQARLEDIAMFGTINDLAREISGSDNRSKIRAIKNTLWLSLFLDDATLDKIQDELASEGYK